jgi:hypothetical protein
LMVIGETRRPPSTINSQPSTFLEGRQI